jgi:hypothetical protein
MTSLENTFHAYVARGEMAGFVALEIALTATPTASAATLFRS